MGTIKFRSWDYGTRGWYYFHLNQILPSEEGKETFNKISADGGRWFQFTGIKDKNGVEIYEGDIIKYRITFGKSRDIIREMKWKEEFNGFGPMEYKCEVIGNIYENQ